MDLSVKPREKFGKAVKQLRRAGLIPAELYGHGTKNIHVSVPVREFAKVFKEAGTNTVVNLLVDGKKQPVLIQDIERNYLSDEIAHIDFYQVRMDEKLKAKIPLEFVGESPAVKEKAGILNKAMTEIEVEALPSDLPHRFSVDLSRLLDLNQSMYVKDIAVPKGVEVLVDPETVVATITPPVAEEEKIEAPVVDVTAVKVETEEKKMERTAEKEQKEQKE
ncbi:MAG: 50S ribosomal protein L25 [Candidatus Liptonbacteria bacterium]|nr:50S ribosomal protein L25 [Candidatus Liptonbacteria bacterium]